MSFRNYIIKCLTDMGMFESQAISLLESYMTTEESYAMKERWDDAVDGYPSSFKNVVWVGVKYFAASWIEENIPQAWYLPMFQNKV